MIRFLVKATAYGVAAYIVQKQLEKGQVLERLDMVLKPVKDQFRTVVAGVMQQATAAQNQGRTDA